MHSKPVQIHPMMWLCRKYQDMRNRMYCIRDVYKTDDDRIAINIGPQITSHKYDKQHKRKLHTQVFNHSIPQNESASFLTTIACTTSHLTSYFGANKLLSTAHAMFSLLPSPHAIIQLKHTKKMNLCPIPRRP